MSAEQNASLMQRKARIGREAYAARAMSLARALRLTAAKQAEHLMGLGLAAVSVTRRVLPAEDLLKTLDPEWLILLMDGPSQRVGAVMLDSEFATGLVQQQTMGKIAAPPPAGAPPRRHTSTDAALCAPFIEALLARAALLPEEEADRDLLAGYRFGVRAQEPRHAQLAMDAGEYEMVEMTLDMAAGTRMGQLRLILPERAAAAASAPPPAEHVLPGIDPVAPTQILVENVMGLQAELTVALTRLRLPLQQVSALRAGDVVNLNLSTMEQSLVLDASGKVLSRGTLGQIDGMRALQVEQQDRNKITEPRRRASDRGALDMPDVTGGRRAEDMGGGGFAPDIGMDLPAMGGLPDMGLPDVGLPDVGLPAMADVDIFGSMDDLPDLPDLDLAEQAADDQMAQWEMPVFDPDEDQSESYAG